MAKTRKYQAPEFAAMSTGSRVRRDAFLRGGAGTHDPRPHRQRSRGDGRRAAIKDAS